jgi:membrane-bound lytic murein transglycosylase B
MKATFKALAVVATLSVASTAFAAVTPAEEAGMCAANALKIYQFAQANGPQYAKLASLANAQIGKDFEPFKNQPGFKDAAQWEMAQNLTIQQRVKIADGCTAQGF